jgi:hypothetical protein
LSRVSKLLIGSLLVACATAIFVYYPTDRKRIKGVIESCQEAIEDKDLEKLMEHISYNYSDDHGGSYLIVKRRMEYIFKSLNDIQIEKDLINLSVNGTYAEAKFMVRVMASRGDTRGYILGDAVNREKIKVYFEKTGYEWKVIKTEGIFGQTND